MAVSPALCKRMDTLTHRERVIARYVAFGFRSKYIAEIECVSERTVRTQLEMIYTKLGAIGRTQLAVLAVISGLVEPEAVVQAWQEHAPEVFV